MPDSKTGNKQDERIATLEEQLAEQTDRNTELELQVQGLAADLHALLRSQLGNATDPKAAARERLGRTLVQFTRHYNRSSVPSTVKDCPHVLVGYSVSEGEVAYLRDDEVERITKEFPDLLVVGKGKFKQRTTYTPKPELVGKNQYRWKVEEKVQSVDELIEAAPELA